MARLVRRLGASGGFRSLVGQYIYIIQVYVEGGERTNSIDIGQLRPVLEAGQAVFTHDLVQQLLGLLHPTTRARCNPGHDEPVQCNSRRIQTCIGQNSQVKRELDLRHPRRLRRVLHMLGKVPLAVLQPLLQVAHMQLSLQLEQLLSLPLPRRQESRQVIQRRERVDNVSPDLARPRKLRLHALPIHKLLLVPRLQPIPVVQAVDGAGHRAFKVVVEVHALFAVLVPLAEHVPQQLLRLEVLQRAVVACSAQGQERGLHLLVEPVLVVVLPQQHVHAPGDELAGHDHARAVRVSRAAPVEKVVGGLVGGEDDEGLSAHAEVHDGAIFLAPVVQLQPLQALGELVDVSDEGGRLGTWW